MIFINKICCFAGHRDIYDNSVADKISETVITLIENEGVKTFWVGNYGDFDRCSAAAVRNLKKLYPGIKLELIIPYPTKEMERYIVYYNSKYDSILMADIPETTPARLRIRNANRYMVDNSDYLICYVRHSWGGAAQTMEYAEKKKNIRIINLAK